MSPLIISKRLVNLKSTCDTDPKWLQKLTVTNIWYFLQISLGPNVNWWQKDPKAIVFHLRVANIRTWKYGNRFLNLVSNTNYIATLQGCRETSCLLKSIVRIGKTTTQKEVVGDDPDPIYRIWVCMGKIWVLYGCCMGWVNPGFTSQTQGSLTNIRVCTGKIRGLYGCCTGAK